MPTQTVRDPNRWAVLALLGVAQLMVVLDATIVTVALPSAQRALHFSNDSRQWVVTAYALAFGSLLLVGGKVGDLFGRKWALIAGLVGFSAASAVGGLAQSFDVLVFARATQGVFAALLAPVGAFAVDGHVRGDCGLGPGVRDLRRGRRRRRGAGAAARGCADAGALVAVVPLRQSRDRGAHHDRGVAPARQPQASRPRPDRHSRRAHLALGLFALVFGFSNAETHGWGATATIAALIASPVLLTAFVLIERRVKHPLLPLHIVWDRARGGSYTALFVTGAGIFAVFLFLTYFMQQNLGFSPLKTGLAFLPLTAVLVITSTTVQTRVIQRTGVKPLVLIGMALGVIGMLLFTQLTPTSSYGTGVLPGLLVIGVGMGCIFAPAFSAATLGVAPNEAGIASAMVNTSQQVGGSIGTSLLSTIYASAVASYVATHLHVRGLAAAAQVHGETTAFWWAAGIFGLGFVLALVILPSRCEARTATTLAALARHAIGNCNYDDSADGAAVTDGAGSPEPALAP